MSSSLALGVAGPQYHPDEPFGFHPALHAAGHLLRAAHDVDPGLPQAFGARLLDPALLGHRRDRQLERIVSWAEERHLASPYVLEVLYLTSLTWVSARRRLELVKSDSTCLSLDLTDEAVREAEETCREALSGWGPWVRLVTRDPAEVYVDGLIELAAPLQHLVPPHRVQTEDRLEVEVPAWNPELETWDAAEARLRADFDKLLEAHRSEIDHERDDLRAIPVKTAQHHFTWLARRQLVGDRPATIARSAGVGASTVHAALRQLSDLLELPLRPVKPGPQPW